MSLPLPETDVPATGSAPSDASLPDLPGRRELPDLPEETLASSTSGVRLEGISVRLGGKDIIPGLDLDVRRGEMLCLLGPSGCGKTTTLRMIGGFLQPDAGRIVIGDRDWAGKPPEQRPTAMVFQNYALWPHMSVARNVGYPLVVRRMPKAEREERVRAILAMVGLEQKAGRRPARLSGGEQQRVALARALVQRPEVLLLDEPLSNLDAKLRVQVREDIRAIQQELGITSVFVTHDQEEALAVADRIAVMDGGRIVQLSDPVTLYRRPATEGVARFIGSMGFLDGELRGGPGGLVLEADGSAIPIASATTTQPGPAQLGIRPEQVRLEKADDGTTGAELAEDATRRAERVGDRSEGGALWTVERVTPRGHDAAVTVRRGALTLTALAPVTQLRPGDRVRVGIGEALVYRDGMLVEDEAR